MSTQMLDVAVAPTNPVEITYSPRARIPRPGQIVPPVPGTDAFRTVRGRAGDLIVIQLKSGEHLTHKRRDALRTLGLHGIRSAVLRRSNDETFWGLTQKLRDVIAIIQLPELVYGWDASKTSRSDSDIEVEEPKKYGTASKPAKLWRSTEGEYFGFEFEADRLFAYWSTQQSFDDVSDGFRDFGLLPNDNESYLAIHVRDEVRQFRGPWKEIKHHASGAAVASLASIAVDDTSRIIWKEPHSRFWDMDTTRAELGIVSAPADPFLTRQLARTTANRMFLDSAACDVEIRVQGRSRKVPM